jgi:hypothetical protein
MLEVQQPIEPKRNRALLRMVQVHSRHDEKAKYGAGYRRPRPIAKISGRASGEQCFGVAGDLLVFLRR